MKNPSRYEIEKLWKLILCYFKDKDTELLFEVYMLIKPYIGEKNMSHEIQKEFTLRQLQENLAWTLPYSQDFIGSNLPHKHFVHALSHASKALGKLHALAARRDHCENYDYKDALREIREQKYVADLVICALRISNVFPGRKIDLQEEVIDRIENKNEVKL